jgi:HD domain
MLAGAVAFEISDIQEDESEAALARRSNVTMLHWVENGWMEFSRSTADIVLAHHEFFDGTCYPRGLRGEQIPLGARIISIADGLDAMLSDWPYRNALPIHTHARRFAAVLAHNSTQRLWRFFSPFQRATGSISVKASAHPSASLICRKSTANVQNRNSLDRTEERSSLSAYSGGSGRSKVHLASCCRLTPDCDAK